MPQCIAAVFKAALKALQALLCPPKGRHSAGQLRRRRSTRVRRYAPRTPAAPTPLPSHPAARNPQVSAAERPRPKPPASSKTPAALKPPAGSTSPTALKPPTVEIDADDIALVRPYFTAHEPDGEAERIQNRAIACLRKWGAELWSDPEPVFRFGPAPAGARVYTLDDFRAPDPDPDLDPDPDPDPAPAPAPAPVPDPVAAPSPEAPARPEAAFHVPAPRPPSQRLPARMNELPHLSRIRARQQERLSTTAHAGVSA